MNKITKEVVLKAITIGVIAAGVVLIKECFTDGQEYVSVDINKMVNNNNKSGGNENEQR